MKSRSGFTLIEVMVVIAVLAIIASMAVMGYNAQIKAAHDSKSSVNMLSLVDALDNYYSESGSYPVTCGHSSHAVLGCSQIDSTYTGMTTPPKITAGMTSSQLQAILPGLDEKFTHPRNPDQSPLNRTVSNIIQADSYFLLSMDMVPGGVVEEDGGGGGGVIINPPPGSKDPECPPMSVCIPGPIDTNSGHVQLAQADQSILGVTTTVTASSVRFANPSGSGNFQCNFQLTGKTPSGSQAIQPHQYVVGYVNEETGKWMFYVQDSRPDLNVVNWNTSSTTNCRAESLSALK